MIKIAEKPLKRRRRLSAASPVPFRTGLAMLSVGTHSLWSQGRAPGLCRWSAGEVCCSEGSFSFGCGELGPPARGTPCGPFPNGQRGWFPTLCCWGKKTEMDSSPKRISTNPLYSANANGRNSFTLLSRNRFADEFCK